MSVDISSSSSSPRRKVQGVNGKTLTLSRLVLLVNVDDKNLYFFVQERPGIVVSLSCHVDAL